MVRQSSNIKHTDTVAFEPQTRRWLIGTLLTVLATVGGASTAVVRAAYQVASDVQEMRLAVESRVTKIETLLFEHDRRVERLEAQQDGRAQP